MQRDAMSCARYGGWHRALFAQQLALAPLHRATNAAHLILIKQFCRRLLRCAWPVRPCSPRPASSLRYYSYLLVCSLLSLTLMSVRDPFLQFFEQPKKFWKKKVYCSRHIFSDFSEHQITEKGVQEISLKTVTLQNLEQLSELVNFLEVFKVSGGRVFVQQCHEVVQKVVPFSVTTAVDRF
jgi:hypothetical protein